jgi:hypothetical protein
MQRKGSIFVQIPSYRDTQLIPTLMDMILNADEPALLDVVVCWQHADDEKIDDFIREGFSYLGESHVKNERVHWMSFKGGSIKLIDIDYLASNGCGWARNKIQAYFGNEAYALQIDSHHRFAPGWDSILIGMLGDLRAVSAKPLLTGYPPSFEPGRDPELRQMDAIQMGFDRFEAPSVVRFKSYPMPDWRLKEMPVRARFLSGGFIFADGSFVFDVPNDGAHFFATEEISLAVRAYTHGYDLFHPHRPVLWHQYNRDSAVKVWDDHTPEKKTMGAVARTALDRSARSYLRSRQLLEMGEPCGELISFGEFGLGGERSLADYERYAGLCFKSRGVTQAAIDGLEPASQPGGMYEDELICTLDAWIHIAPDDVGEIICSADRPTVVIYSSDEEEIYRFDLSEEEVSALGSGNGMDYLIGFKTSPKEVPVKYTIMQRGESGELMPHVNGRVMDHEVEQFLWVALDS